MPDRVVAVLGRGVVPAETPILRADDLGALRGDGIFETMHLRAGRPWLLDHAPALGYRAGERLVRPAELADADGVWLVSSVRGAAEVRSLDGVARKPAADTAALLDLLGYGR